MKNKQSVWLRLLCLTVALLCVVGVLSACGDGNKTPSDTTAEPDQDQDTAETGASNYDEDGYLKDSLPSDLNFNDATVSVLYWSDVKMPEFEVESMNGDRVNDSLFSRNNAVEERLGVVFDWIGIPGIHYYETQFVDAIRNNVQSGLNSYDIIAGYSQTMAAVANNNLSISLTNVSYLDLDKPWWPASLTDEAKIGDNLYFVSGDISTNALYMMYATFFNKTVLDQYELESPYDLVEDNEWTLDKMLTMAEEVAYVDRGTEGTKDFGDTFGIIIPWLSLDAYLYGSGIRTVERNSKGTAIVVSKDFVGEKTQNLLEKINTAVWDSDYAMWSDSDTGDVNLQFTNDLCLFYTQRTMDAIQNFSSNKNLKYGVVPQPKWDSAQENYYTAVANTFTLYSISKGCTAEAQARAGAVLECMGSESYRRVTPALFEQTMQLRYSQDPTASAMYDIIRENIVFDVGRIFGRQTGDYTQNQIRFFVSDNKDNWIGTAETFGEMVNAYWEIIFENIGKKQ